MNQLNSCTQIVIINKMKLLIIFVLAAVILVDADSVYKYLSRNRRNTPVCTRGETEMQDCNNCFCLEDGSGWACTMMACDTMSMNVDPGSASMDGSGPQARSGQDNTANPYHCEPNSTWMVDCNTCFCTADGTAAACTLMGCLPESMKPILLNGTNNMEPE